MNVELIPPTDARWRDALTRIAHDVHHLPGYARVEAERQGGEAAALYGKSDRGAEFLLPLLIRPLPQQLELPRDWRDATAPYGYPAPITDTSDSASLHAFLEQAAALAREHNIISLFLRWHPLLSMHTRSPVEHETIVSHGETVYVDLAESPDEWQTQTASGHRYEIRRLRKLDFKVIVDDWSHFAGFQAMYLQTMDRVAARASYNFSPAYFAAIREALGPQLHIASVLSPQHELAASALFTECCGIVQYYLSGAEARFLRLAPTKLLLDEIRPWSKQRKNRVLHLGGGLGAARDSLFDFKAGFSRHRATFHTSRIITDPNRFQLAITKTQSNIPAQHDDYFPPYRRAA